MTKRGTKAQMGYKSGFFIPRKLAVNGDPGGNRTRDNLIKSQDIFDLFNVNIQLIAHCVLYTFYIVSFPVLCSICLILYFKRGTHLGCKKDRGLQLNG